MNYSNDDYLISSLESIKLKLVNKEPLLDTDVFNIEQIAHEIKSRHEASQLDTISTPLQDIISDNDLMELPNEISLNETEDSIENLNQSNWDSFLEEEEEEELIDDNALSENAIKEALQGIDPNEGENTIDLSNDNSKELLAPLLSNIDETEEIEQMTQEIIHFLPNGMANKPYKIDISTTDLTNIDFEDIDGIESIGLTVNKEANTVEGVPSLVGDMEFNIIMTNEENYILRKVRLYINPDPRSLWKHIEPPKDGEFFKENKDGFLIDSNNCRIIAGSMRGRSHAHEGKFRDDDFETKITNNNWNILCVADGAGSAKYSREGSRIVCSTATQILSDVLQDENNELETNPNAIENHENYLLDLFHKVVIECRIKLQEKADQINESISVFNTTLLITIVKDFPNGSFVTSYAIGDGAAVIYHKNEKIWPLMISDGGEYAGQTRFITMKEVEDRSDISSRIKSYFINNYTSILLMTDGVSDPKFDTDAEMTHISNWDGLYEDIESEVDLNATDADDQLTNWLDFFSRGNHDDRTLALLIKK